jgi:DNA-binding transcriptional LysR family regulator
VFDELRQGVKSIEFLADPTAGEIRVAGNEYIIAGLIATAFGRLRRQYPGISIDVAPVGAISEQHRKLRERNVDLVVGRVGQSHEEDIDTEVLFNDRIVVVAGLENPWSRRRKVDLSELADEPWAMPPADTPVGGVVAELFRARGLKFAPRGMARGSVHLACALVASGPFLGILAGSLLRFGTNLPPLKILPVKLSVPPLPVGIMTLKNRTISPVGRLFIDRVRGLARPLAKQRP